MNGVSYILLLKHIHTTYHTIGTYITLPNNMIIPTHIAAMTSTTSTIGSIRLVTGCSLTLVGNGSREATCIKYMFYSQLHYITYMLSLC